MADQRSRRVGALARHLASSDPGSNLDYQETSALHLGTAAQQLQRLLDHDNHEERQRLKDLMKDPLFTP